MLREQYMDIKKDLSKKMVLLSGPRQVGKSYLAWQIMKDYQRPVYLNWDNLQDREVILQQGWSVDTDLLVLDEIHKMELWKNFLKGIWDTRPQHLRILVTGSARLETFRQSGDSLAGRYFHHRLLPLSPAETRLLGEECSLDHFLERGGFPEPYLAESEDEAGRWRRQYLDGLIREDILTFENITRLKAMNLLVELLRERVASPLSYQSLSEDLHIAPNTVKSYIEILEALYIIFLVYPYHHSIARSLVKTPKVYFFDTGLVKGDRGIKLENFVALSLLRELYREEDMDGKRRHVRYLRTKEGREVDFIVTEENAPKFMVEVKQADRSPAKNLLYFNERYSFPGVQLVADLRLEKDTGTLKLRRLMDWLSEPDRWL